MFDYDVESKIAAETLDKYNFHSVLQTCYGVDLYDIEEILEKFGEEVKKAIEDLTTEELAEYLHQKYGMRVQEVSRYCLWWTKKSF